MLAQAAPAFIWKGSLTSLAYSRLSYGYVLGRDCGVTKLVKDKEGKRPSHSSSKLEVTAS